MMLYHGIPRMDSACILKTELHRFASIDGSPGPIGFDGGLFVAGKRAENAGVLSLMSSRKE